MKGHGRWGGGARYVVRPPPTTMALNKDEKYNIYIFVVTITPQKLNPLISRTSIIIMEHFPEFTIYNYKALWKVHYFRRPNHSREALKTTVVKNSIKKPNTGPNKNYHGVCPMIIAIEGKRPSDNQSEVHTP